MSRLTLGAIACLTLAAAATVSVLNHGPSNITLSANSAGPGQTTTAAPTGASVVAPAMAAATTTSKTTAKTTTTTPKLPLPVPAPTKLTPQPDPNSAACRANPSTPFCGVDSVRYVILNNTLAAHTRWLPVLKAWGLTDVNDTCVTQPAQADLVCAVQGTHGNLTVSVLFKRVYEGKYAPTNVKKQSTAIQTKALTDIAKAKTVAQKAKILKDSAAKIAAVEKAANAWNAAHPKTTINVAVDPKN